MAYRTPADVKEEFLAHPRRVLIMTTVVYESRSVKAHLTDPERLIGDRGGLYEYGRFSDPAGEWIIVHAITPQGNSDAGLVASKAYQEFGNFHAQMFVGVAGSLKEDIPIGSVVVGDYVYNGHSAKVEDTETLSRPHGLPAARELLTAAQGLIYDDDWSDLIRAPARTQLPSRADYPCKLPPSAFIKGIVSGEEVVAGGKSKRYGWIRSHFNDCGAVEMEGWGAMSAAHHENASAIVVRGISDMCAGKEHATDNLLQPIAAAHAAAFAFGILSFRSKVPVPDGPVVGAGTPQSTTKQAEPENDPHAEERRVECVFNFEDTKDEWSEEVVKTVVERLKRAFDDENLNLIRIDEESIRLVMNVRDTDVAAMDLAKLRRYTADTGVTLLGVMPLKMESDAENAKVALAAASVDLLAWEKTLPDGRWMERPERESIEARLQLDTSSTVLLGEPGSGKSALLSRIASDLLDQGAIVFALKSDFLSTGVQTESDLQQELQLPAPPSDLILRLAALQPVYIFIDQLDALASQLDLRSGRLNVLMNLVRRVSGMTNVHVLLSARTFEFNHDVRLRAVGAEAVELALPPWHEVKERLTDVGVDPDTWPEIARDVVRIPQALKTFIVLVDAGRTEPFTTYQAMLEQLWRDRLASAEDSASLIELASDLAGQMAEEEALWLAASRFDDRLNSLTRLEALGFIVRSENDLSIAFSHQTVFDYVLARTFVQSAGLLSTYVLERQDSLFVRAKVWSALNYLRESEVNSYARELLKIWTQEGLRRHLHLLLIEFIGQLNHPLDFEKKCMSEVLASTDLRLSGLKAIGNRSEWFTHFASTAIRNAMSGTDAEANYALKILTSNWRAESDRVIRLIKENWLPHPEKDSYSWMAVHECPVWTDEVEEIASLLLERSPVSICQVNHTALTIAVDQPDVAVRLVRRKLDFLLAEAKGRPEPIAYPVDGTEAEKTAWYFKHRPTKDFDELLDAMEWNDLPALAEDAAAVFLQILWPWYVDVFSEIVARTQSEDVKHIYPGQYVLEIEKKSSEARSSAREKPLVSALQIAVEELAGKTPDGFSKWAEENSQLDIIAIQQLIAHGYEVAADMLASRALKWLLLDPRRFQLGTRRGYRHTTIDLVRACAPHWTNEEVGLFENAVLDYRPSTPEHLSEPKQRKLFADMIRATKKDLFIAVGVDRLAPKNRELVATEQRALGNRFDSSIREREGGWIGSPMEAADMAKAKNRDILKLFREIPDITEWDHPKDWMRGGNIQLSRAFADFAKADPERAIRLIAQFEPRRQERAAGYALEAMAGDALNDNRVVDAFVNLHARGFQDQEFRESAARAIEKIASRKVDIADKVIDILVDWLRVTPTPTEEVIEEEDVEDLSESIDEDLSNGSILWGFGSTSALPGGNFNILSALASILLNRKVQGRDRYFEILDHHLSCEQNPNIWKALLFRLSNAGGSTPRVVSTFLRKLFDRFPEVLASREAVIFLAYAQRWDDELVFDLIIKWPKSDRAFLQRSYGELVGLIATVKEKENWESARDEIIASSSSNMKIGLAHAAVNMWSDEKLRSSAGDILVALLKGASEDLVAVVMDVFRVTDELVPDTSTEELLRALADPSTDMSAAPSHFVVERLHTLIPYEAELVATIAEKLVAAWRGGLREIGSEVGFAAQQLTDLALTLHRLGGVSRQSGIALFEAMIEIDAYGARETLVEIDGRFGQQQAVARQRLARRRRPRGQRRSRF